MIALLRADLRSRWRSLAALTAGCFTVLIALSGTYTAYGGPTAFEKSFGAGKTPKLFSAFSGSSSTDIFTPTHFLAFGFGHPLFLVLALSVAITSGVAAVATDVETGRAELLFTAPVRRRTILDTRIAAWVVAQVVVIAGGLAGALLGTRLSGDLSHVSVAVPLRVAVQFSSVAVFVAAVAFAASARSRTRAAAFGLTVGVTAGSYVANLVALLWHPMAFMRRVNPFGYYSPTDASAHIDWANVGVLLGAAVLLMVVAHRWLEQRDLA